jgi:hypothetical protein
MNQEVKRNPSAKTRTVGVVRSVAKTIKVSQEVANYLNLVGSGIVEDEIRKTKEFKDWARSQ